MNQSLQIDLPRDSSGAELSLIDWINAERAKLMLVKPTRYMRTSTVNKDCTLEAIGVGRLSACRKFEVYPSPEEFDAIVKFTADRETAEKYILSNVFRDGRNSLRFLYDELIAIGLKPVTDWHTSTPAMYDRSMTLKNVIHPRLKAQRGAISDLVESITGNRAASTAHDLFRGKLLLKRGQLKTMVRFYKDFLLTYHRLSDEALEDELDVFVRAMIITTVTSQLVRQSPILIMNHVFGDVGQLLLRALTESQIKLTEL